jgi:hypothetical protein
MFSILTKLWLIKTISICSIFLVSSIFPVTRAQVTQTGRFEVPINNHSDFFEIVPASDNGLYVHRRLSGLKKDQFQLIKLDTSFKQSWFGFIPVEKNYRLMGTKAFDEQLFLLLRYKDYSKNDLILFIIHETDGHYIQYPIRGFIPFTPTEFQITDKAALIGGYYNRIPVVLHFSFSTFRSKVLPGLFTETGELTQIKTYDDGSFDVLVSAKNHRRQRTLWIKNYSPEGNLYRNLALEPEENKHLIFGRSLKTDGDKQIVAGVYGTRSSEFSRGVFIATIEPSGLEQIRYYNFGDLQNFFRYMKANREERIKNRIQRKKIKGKKIKFNYRFLVHELVPYKDEYVLLGEAFYPRYQSVDRGYYSGFFNPNGIMQNSIIQNGRIFNGYYYTHAVVMGFNENGKLLWDNSFEINDVKTFTLEQFVKLEVLPDRLALMYLFENHIRTKIIKDDVVLEGKTKDPIRTFNKNDTLKPEKNHVNKLEYWYKNYLYAYGVQDVVAHSDSASEKRKVFFINKIHYPK